MADVLEFPSPRAQGMAYLQRQLRELLSARGADEQLIEFATDQLTRLYDPVNASEQYSFSVRLPEHLDEGDKAALESQINDGLEGIRKVNHTLLLELMAQLVLTQVKLFQHERSD